MKRDIENNGGIMREKRASKINRVRNCQCLNQIEIGLEIQFNEKTLITIVGL